MRTCALSGGVTRLSGIDQFVYCAERNLAARLANPYNSWRTYTSFSGQGSALWDASKVRGLWRYNLYNLGSLP